MKTIVAFFSLLVAAGAVLRAQVAAPATKPFELYAEFVNDTQIQLSDGAIWAMDKGDCFPIYMFKDQQTKLILKLASATFQVDAKNLKVLPETENERALVSYRKNLAQYLNKQPEIWKNQVKAEEKSGKPGKEKEKDKTPPLLKK